MLRYGLKQETGQKSRAEETLYLIIRYFGWQATILRYGPYTSNAAVIHFSEAIRHAFADSAYPVGAFAFFRPEQKALGKMVMERFKGQYGIGTRHHSLERLHGAPEKTVSQKQRSRAAEHQGFGEVNEPAKLAGRERLIQVQRCLVSMLEYLERKEHFSLFPGRRKKCPRSTPSSPESVPLES